MEKVIGIGDFFFQAKGPAALTKWYEQHLGIVPPPPDYLIVRAAQIIRG